MVLAAYMDPSLKHLPIVQDYLDVEMITMGDLIRDKCDEFGISTLPSASVQQKPGPTSKTSSAKPSTRMRMELIQKHSNALNRPHVISRLLNQRTKEIRCD